MGLSRTVISVKNRKFFPPLKCPPRWRYSIWNWVSALGAKKLEWWATGPRKKFDDIFSRLDTIHQRDGRTAADNKDRAYA